MVDPTTARDWLRTYGSPLFVLDLDRVRAQARALRAAFSYEPLRLLYAMKANPLPAVVRALHAEGFGVDAVSPGEVALALRAGIPPEQVLFTENNMADDEQAWAVGRGVLINAGSLDRLERLGAAGVPTCAVRFNPDVGTAHHAHTLTAGPLTKFGVHHSQVDDVRAIEARTGIRVIGCHMHIGSGGLDAQAFVEAMGVILGVARRLPNLSFIDFGGGIGIPYRPDQHPIDVPALGAQASELMRGFRDDDGRTLELRLEPGRFLVAEAGVLLTTVTSRKTNPASADAAARTYIGCDTGFNHLVRPCLYGSYHGIANVTRPDAAPETVDVVGNVCESGDVFARDRQLPRPEVGDILALQDAGAYGSAMASSYNTRAIPAEIVIEHGRPRLARRRIEVDDLLAAYPWDDA